jgi:CheY-like chemotaxis protein
MRQAESGAERADFPYFNGCSEPLAKPQYEVSIAIDGHQGLAMASRGGFDLVLMDMSLPEMDGWEVARRLRADPNSRSLPIIALTAHAMAGDREKALEAGCDDYDSKPVDFPRLLGKIEALLGRTRPPEEGAESSP